MRRLNAKQKKLLDIWYEKNKEGIEAGRLFFDLGKCDLFNLDFYEELQKINDFEILYQEINNYIQEK